MEDYVEDYKYNNCFWKKSGVLYNHVESKFKEYLSIGDMFDNIVNQMNLLCSNLEKIPKFYKPSDDQDCTRSRGISVFIHSIKLLNNELRKISKKINKISEELKQKIDSYNSKKEANIMCDNSYKIYQNDLTKLSQIKNAYFDTINKGIEYYLTQKYANKLDNIKIKAELKNKKKLMIDKKLLYKKQIEKVENSRVEYMEIQGNIFASQEDFEQECTKELKDYFNKYFGILKDSFKGFNLSEKDLNTIENIDGVTDNKRFAEKNKSLMTGPKRNLYKEYCEDLSYYTEHFDVVKSRLKGKNPKEIRDINNRITIEVSEFLKDIIKEEPDQINLRIEQIAKDIKNSCVSQKDYDYLINQFQKRYEEFKKWKKSLNGQDFKKVGKEWDDRFCYMHTFLGYFNKTRVENKELDKNNFNYLCNAILKILELNENEDIDYNLCDLVIILSSTFYMSDPNYKNGKKYINEEIKNCSIMQKQGFWVGLTRYELNEEIQQQNKIEDTLKENDITEEKLNNSVIAKLMSVSYNIIQFIMDSNLFNRVLFDIFKYCKINAENRLIVVEMIDSQIKGENITHLKLDREKLLAPTTSIIEEKTIETPLCSINCDGNI